jgi:mannose/fructose-specific phosphotransferase system component IIA
MNPTDVRHRPFALLVTHGALGAEFVRTAEAILGAQSDVSILSNDGYSSDDLTRAIEETVRSAPHDRPVVLFTDLAAGSCGIASRRAAHGDRVVRKVTGVNLPMLLEFFHYRDTIPLDELLPRLEAKGKAGIVVH